MRGGERKGAGRKPMVPGQVKQHYSCRIAPEALEWIKSQPRPARVIDDLIKRAMDNDKTER